MSKFVVILTSILSVFVISAPAEAIKTQPLLNQSSPTKSNSSAVVELAQQMLSGRAAPIEYWLDVAECETRSDWRDHGQFAGGLGIYTAGKFPQRGMGTWERWGGEQFASSPDKASFTEQIVVANRIAVFGWSKVVVRKDGGKRNGLPATYVWERSGIGYKGWGCIKNYKYLDLSQWMSNTR